MSPGINKLFSSVSGLFSKKGPSVLGIDISSSAVKVVQLKKQMGKAVLETYGEIALGPYRNLPVGQAVKMEPELLSQALKDVVGEAKVTTKDAGCAIPLSSSLVTHIEVPALDPKKLKSVIPIQARKYIPVPVSDVMLDWHVIPKMKRGEEKEGDAGPPHTDVLLVAIHNETLTQYQKILEEADLNISFFEIEVFSTTRSALDQGIAPILIVDIGTSTTKLYVVEAGVVKSSHIVNRGGQDLSLVLSKSLTISFEKAEELKRMLGAEKIENEEDVRRSIAGGLEHIYSEIERVVHAHERKENYPITKVLLSGGGALTHGFADLIGERLSAEVSIADPFSKTSTPAFLKDILREAGPEFSVAVGVALRKLEESD